MCLAIPMKLVELRSDGTGVAEVDGSRHDVSLTLLPGVSLGDYVIVHAGFAIERVNEQEADTVLGLFAELAALQRQEAGDSPQAAPATADGATP
jgi:hydrogenase expression/formation protein HypC